MGSSINRRPYRRPQIFWGLRFFEDPKSKTPSRIEDSKSKTPIEHLIEYPIEDPIEDPIKFPDFLGSTIFRRPEIEDPKSNRRP